MKLKYHLSWLFVCILVLSISSGTLAAPPMQEPTPAPEKGKALLPEIQALDQETAAKIEPLVVEELSRADQTDFFIWMADEADLRPAYQLKTKEEKGRFVFDTLRQTAKRSQAALRLALDDQAVDYRPFYIANKILVQGGNAALLASAAARPDVARITANHQFQLEEPSIDLNAPAHTLTVESNLSFVNADDVWVLGYDGRGTVLAGNDTGLDWDHPALVNQYRGWDGVTVDHNYNWWDATGTYPTVPSDGHGHGTHTTGTMVGDDGGANLIGMAPGARTVHCKNMTDWGSGSDATITECFEWDLAPWDLNGTNPRPDLAPDAINNSWGFSGGSYPAFEDEIAALQAAGIVVEFSAGNSGPYCTTLGSPGDYRQSLTTGSVGHAGGSLPGTLTSFSSRGPSNLYPADYMPDVMAPGENIRSSVPGGSYQGGWSGTSMSGPHVTGLIGLLWSANPGLRGMVTETVHIILDTAVPLTGQTGSNCGGDYAAGPNNDWGYGTIDALAAVQQAILYGDSGTLAGTVTDELSLAPVASATIQATLSPTLTWQTASDALGTYSMHVFSGTHTVTAVAYGYQPESMADVSITSGATTTLAVLLTPAPTYVVSGTVTDANAGWPLYASIDVDGYPGGTVWTDPVTGYYSITLAAGISYIFNVNAWPPGYNTVYCTVGPLTGDRSENLSLDVDPAACTAPGYSPTYAYLEDFDTDGGYTHSGTQDEWEWGMPAIWPNHCSSGANCWGTDLDSNYQDYASQELVSTLIDLSSVPVGVALTARWRQAWAIESSWYDHAYAEVSINGGPWTEMWSHSDGTTQVGWTEMAQDISTAAGGNVQFRWRLTSDHSITYEGLYIDDVAIMTGCDSMPGGLVVGNVYDANTGDALNGASLGNDSGGSTITSATPDDPAVEDGFYTLFSPAGTHVFTATLGGYGSDVQRPIVVQNDTIRQDFDLATGRLSQAPPTLEATLDMGTRVSVPFTLTNSGGAAATFELQERDKGFLPSGLVLGHGEWLYQKEAGALLAVNGGQDGSALAHPSAYRWQPGQPLASPNVLVYADDIIHTAPNTFVDQALQSLGLAYTAHYGGDWNNFETDLIDETWDLILVANDYWGPPASTLTALDNYVDDGGRLIFHGWTVGSDPGHPLWATLGFTWVSDNVAFPDPVYWWEPGHPIFTTPQSVPEFTSLTGGMYGIYGQHVEPLAGFEALAGYTVAGQIPNETALVLGNDNRTVFRGFLDGQNDADVDADTVMDGVELWINLIESIEVGFGTDVTWLHEFPITGTVDPSATRVITITLDAGGPGVTQLGRYHAELRIENDTPYELPSVPVTMTVQPNPSMGQLQGTVSGDRPGGALEGALVEVISGTTSIISGTTDPSGSYAWWLMSGAYSVTTSAEGYLADIQSVSISPGVTTTRDVTLPLNEPRIEVTPDAYDETLAWGAMLTRTLTVQNDGPAALDFNLVEIAGQFIPHQVTIGSPAAIPLTPEEKVEAQVWTNLEKAADGQTEFLVLFRQQADLRPAYAIEDWEERGRFVLQALQETAASSQAEALAQAQSLAQSGEASRVRSHYIVNALYVQGSTKVVEALATRPEVVAIRAVRSHPVPEPIAGEELFTTDSIEWNIAHIGADLAWSEFGVRGEGIVVANIDTGVHYSHEALVNQYRGNQGSGSYDHNYNWWDPDGMYNHPTDNNGHGTHTMGTMVGDDGGRNQVGVAPGAKWIAAQGCDNSWCSETDLLSAAEWILAPWDLTGDPATADPSQRPHVVNNSWGGWGGDSWYMSYVDAWRAAGIFPAFAIGNSGSSCSTAGSPGDYPQSFGTGATDNGDVIAYFSSRGPSSFGVIKPDVSAPGVNVRSAWNSGDGAYNSISGTSMASPHTAGLVALMWSANGDLMGQIDQTAAIIQQTAVWIADTQCGDAGPPNNVYGSGRIDAYQALSQVGGDVPWVAEEPETGTVPAYSVVPITLTFDASQVDQPGTYRATLRVNNNDPYNPTVDVPVTMRLGALETWAKLTGTVRGLGHCDANPAPLEDATLLIEGSTGVTWTLESDANGAYQLWLDQAHSPLTVTAMHPDHETSQVTGVSVTAQMTTTQDVSLRWLQPCLGLAPPALSARVAISRVATRTLTLSNQGALMSNWRLAEADGGFAPTHLSPAGPLHAGGQARVIVEDKEDNSTSLDNAPLPLASGGPDPFGYTYHDSTEANGPVYQWIEIAPPAGGNGLEISGLTGVDDGYFWPLSLPFPLNFYGTDYDQLAVASNGTLYFEDDYQDYLNAPIPDSNPYGVERFIAHLWDDLVVDPGAVYYQAMGSMLVIEYYQVRGYATSGSGSWEVILFANGNILFQYQDATIGGFRDYGSSATVGIQGDATTGLPYSYNTPALFDGLAICFAYPGQSPNCSPDVPWLSKNPTTGSVGADDAQTIDVILDASAPEVMQPGEYYATLIVQTDDPVRPWLQVPVTMTVTSYGVKVTPATDAKSGDPSATVTYRLHITNTGLQADTFDIAVSGNNWSTTAPTQLGPLAAGAGTNVDVTVTLPVFVAGGTTDVAIVTVTSQGDDSQSATATLTTMANNVYAVHVAPSAQVDSGGPGAVVTYTLQITNAGNTTDTFAIAARGNAWPTAVPVEAGPSGVEIQVGPLAAGASDTIDILVAIPPEALLGATDVVTLTITSQSDDARSATATLTTTVTRPPACILFLPIVVK